MIEMRRDDAKVQMLAKVEQRAGKRDRIRAARKSDENGRAPAHVSARQHRLDRVDDLRSSVLIHHVEIIPASDAHQTRYAIRADRTKGKSSVRTECASG